MKKKTILFLWVLLTCHFVWGTDQFVDQVRYSGPFEIKTPFLSDSLNVQGKKYTEKELLNSKLPFSHLRENARILTGANGELILPGSSFPYALHLLSFQLGSDRYCEGTLMLDGLEEMEVYIDGKIQKLNGKKLQMTLLPKCYEVVVKYLSTNNDTSTFKASFHTDSPAVLTSSTDSVHPYTLTDVMDGIRMQYSDISPDGKFIIISYQETFPGGKQTSFRQIVERTTGKIILANDNRMLQWMPQGSRAYYTRQSGDKRELRVMDVPTLSETLLVADLPEGSIRFSPAEDYLLINVQEKGPEERKDIYEVLEPADRQPGWRNRTFMHKYDLNTGVFQRLTYGYQSTMVNDISQDGRYILFSVRESILTERPFYQASLYKMDVRTGEVETILKGAKFVSRAQFSPDGNQLLISGSPEAFDGIGLNVKPGQIANSGEGQVFLYNLPDNKIIPLTKYFNPAVDRAIWSMADKQIYLMAKDRDYVRMYVVDPVKGNIRQLPGQEDVIAEMSLAKTSPVLVYSGMSGSNSQRLYAMDLKKNATQCLVDLSKDILKDVKLGELKDWNFVSATGDTIYGRYYLPPNFDPTRKYPLIVNYYGGTTPTARVLENRYPSHVYAAMGFVVYIVQPSGATGFGQDFAARHVNTWGKQTGDEIIEGTKKFCDAHSFINREKVGCMGASYGGFMTMYLQTKTDIFAAAMSHAGISDITSYWGEGYWGYSYNSQAAANSYPWNARDIYVEQSPLFHADKINTPILFLHGAADTNVPVGESIQMFTALKLLGKPTAMVLVPEQDHHILDYDKRIRWNYSIYAWFYKWLNDDPAWWDALYPPKTL